MWCERRIEVEDELGYRDYGVGKWLFGARTLDADNSLDVSGLCTEAIRKLVFRGTGEGGK